jgi:hypothetical protein
LEWDPSVLDHEFREDEQWGEAPTFKSQFNEVGDYNQRVVLHHNTYVERQDSTTTDDIIEQRFYATHMSTPTSEHEGIMFYDMFQTELVVAPKSSQAIIPKTTVKHSPNVQQLHPFFGWMFAGTMQKTYEHTTQYSCLPTSTMLKKPFRSRLVPVFEYLFSCCTHTHTRQPVYFFSTGIHT